jgi:hypothetical protein
MIESAKKSSRGAVKATQAGSKADLIVTRFPGPVELRVSRLKWLGLLGASLAFAVGSIYMAHDGGALKPSLALVFFGACGIVAAVMLLPGAGGITLRADGFETITLF